MNTKGVEDGLSDMEQCRCKGEFHDESCKCSCGDYNKDPLCIMHQRAIRSATPEELTAQPAVPVEERTQINHIWSGKEKMPCGCSAKTEYPYYNAETGHVHCIACGDSYDHPPIPEERTIEMETKLKQEPVADGGGTMGCKYCGGLPDHKCGQFHACGDCCGNHGELRSKDKRLYEWVKQTANAHGASQEAQRAAREENERLNAVLNTPETEDFFKGIELEAAHQRQRWPSEQDAGKTHADWFWLVGYLAGKCLHSAASGDANKALHYTISTAAALANWHRAIKGAGNMRPGIAPPTDSPEGSSR